MNKSYGLIIKYYRKKQGLSQMALADGICVASYLSKIENGEITPGLDLLNDFSKRLNQPLLKQSYEQGDFELCDRILEFCFTFRKEEGKDLFEQLKADLSLSEKAFEYLAIVYTYEKDDLLGQLLKDALPHLNESVQWKVALLLYDETGDSKLLDVYYRSCGYGQYLKGLYNFKHQAFKAALACFKEAEVTYLEEGSLHGLLPSIRYQGIVFTVIGQLEQALKTFERLYKLALATSSDDFSAIRISTRYNMNYLKHLLGKTNELKEIIGEMLQNNEKASAMLYHTLFQVLFKEDPKAAEAVLNKGLCVFSDPTSSEHHLLQMGLMKLKEPEFWNASGYYEAAKKRLQFLLDSGDFISYHLMIKDFIQYLKHKRRYKEALEIIENMKMISF